ncbi:hypothetical protein QZH41_002633 [Actinostola sp. cb2023]|nr:hypothetical protein QZH41_002633 [Actinostola sp. cb2023]
MDCQRSFNEFVTSHLAFDNNFKLQKSTCKSQTTSEYGMFLTICNTYYLKKDGAGILVKRNGGGYAVVGIVPARFKQVPILDEYRAASLKLTTIAIINSWIKNSFSCPGDSEFYYPERDKENENATTTTTRNDDNISQDIQEFIEDQRPETTKKKPDYDIGIWKKLCSSNNENREIEEIPAVEMNVLLCRFFMNVKKKKWRRVRAFVTDIDAQKYSKPGLVSLHTRQAKNEGDGENIYMAYGMVEMGGAEVVDAWYAEVKDYDFENDRFSGSTGHFTQVVWKGSKELGMAKAKSSDGKFFVVGRYRPAGNFMSQFDANISPP